MWSQHALVLILVESYHNISKMSLPKRGSDISVQPLVENESRAHRASLWPTLRSGIDFGENPDERRPHTPAATGCHMSRDRLNTPQDGTAV